MGAPTTTSASGTSNNNTSSTAGTTTTTTSGTSGTTTSSNVVNNDGLQKPKIMKPGDTNSLYATYASLIRQYLQLFCHDNALFLAERYVAVSKTTESLYLLALVHYRMGSPQKAAHALMENYNSIDSNSQYLLAQCCFDLKLYTRAEEALLKQVRQDYHQAKPSMMSVPPMDEWILQSSPCPIPNGAAGLYLLGNICRESHRKSRAMLYYHMSLKLDPLMWSSYEALCEIGAVDDMDPTSVFGVRPSELDQVGMQHTNQRLSIQENNGNNHNNNNNILTPSFMSPVERLKSMDISTPGMPKETTNMSSSVAPKTQNSKSRSAFRFETPNLTPIPMQQDDASFEQYEGVVRRAKDVAARLYYQPSPAETPDYFQTAIQSSINSTTNSYLKGLSRAENSLFSEMSSDTPLRRGGGALTPTSRKPRTLFLGTSENNNSNSNMDDDALHSHQRNEQQENERDQDINTIVGSNTNSTNTTTNKVVKVVVDGEDKDKAVVEILELLCLLGSAWWKLCQYRCREALQLFHLLPQAQHNTGWVLHQKGRAYFELTDYQNAHRCLELMQRIEPHRTKGLALFSTVLWQLKKEVEIAHLAQKAVDSDRLSPEAWCVVGNCFSLQKEHETALIFFGRSLQLDPSFTYAHTLSGYEYMANEDFDKAVACFRNAIRVDERHYNAWYGLGAIYHRQEKYDLAEYHFHRAVAINPQSSVLRCNLGMSQYSNGKPFQALDTLAEAFRLDPQNPQARFQRATIYVSLNRAEEAFSELEKVRDAAPREAAIHFAMGKVLKRLGKPEQAMRCFLTALDLDPKDTQLIKSAMDKLDEPDLEEVAAF